MFVDLVGSTLLGAKLDPEDLREAIVAYQNCITSVVARYDGFVARYMGDGALVYFGFPQSQEDDAERAVHAGLAIAEAVSNLSTVAGPAGTLACRAGIATGPVVIGDVIGFGSALESPVVGDTPNLAAGLVTLAEPGMVAIAEATQRLTGGLFEYRVLGPTQLKGRAGPVHAWAVLGETQIDSRFEALRTANLPLVGRTEELSLLVRRWEQAKSDKGRVVHIVGEAGIGKSRLVAALARRVKRDPHAQLRLVCSPHHRDSPLYPVIRQIERSAKFETTDTASVKLGKLARLLEANSISEPDVVLFADLLSIPLPEGASSVAAAPRSKAATLSGIIRQFDRLARHNPVLVVFEDIHWADPTSLDLLELLIETVERLPILVVITTRPELQLSWVSRPQVTVQSLSGLDRRQAASLVKSVARHHVLPKDVVESIVARADGIPLFLEELTKTVLELQPQLQNEQQAFAAGQGEAVVPATLQASLMARLDRLVAAKAVAQMGSVIGREFSFELLQALSGLPRNDLADALAELVQSGLATAYGEPPNATYMFKHALVQDAAYASVLRERRRAIHLDLAKLLEAGTARREEALPEVIAWHWGEAGVPEKAIDHYLKAAERATGRFALKERVSNLRKALRQIDRLPATSEATRRELNLQVELYRALVDEHGSGSEEVLTAVERARALCLMLNDTEELIRVQDGLCNFHFSRSQPAKALRCADEMFDVGRRTGNPQAFLMARKTAGFANLLLGRFETACEDMRNLVASYDEARDGPEGVISIRDPKVGAYTVLGICLTALGQLEAGAATSLEAVSHADRLKHEVSQIVALRRACVQHIMQRDTEMVLQLSERLLAVAAQYETFKGARDGTIFNCWARLQTRRDSALLERMRECIDHFEATRHFAMLPFFMTSAAEIIGGFGDTNGAAAMISRAADLVQLTGEQWSESEVIRLQARYCARDLAHSIALLNASLEKARRQNAKLWELRSAVSLATVWLEQGNRAEARDVLVPVHDWFKEGHNSHDLIAARALLGGLGIEAKSSTAAARQKSVIRFGRHAG